MTFPLFVLSLAGCHLVDGPCPTVDAVQTEGGEAAVAWREEDVRLVVLGEGFDVLPDDLDGAFALPVVALQTEPPVELSVTWEGTDQLSVTLPADPDRTPGVYDLVVANAAGCSATLPDAVEVTVDPPLRLDDSIVIDDITPPFGWTEQQTAVTIRGAGFVSTPRAWLDLDPDDGVLLDDGAELLQVAFIDDGSLTGVVPEGLPVGGPYDLLVVNPDDGYNRLADAFTVTQDAPPQVLDVTPQAGSTQDDTPVQITGEHFDADVTVWLIDAAGEQTAATVSSVADGLIEATVPSSGMGVQQYLVRVVNGDDTWDDWAAFVVRNPSAKLGTAGEWAETSALVQARTGLGLLAHTDSLGRDWLYAVGGEGGGALSTVELAALDAFGALGDWVVLGSELTTPRAHAAFYVADGYLWAAGGDDGSGPLDTVERAVILDGDAGPRPEIEAADIELGGSLAAGTWYYRVSAVMDASDRYNPGGEGLASAVEVVRVAQAGASVALSWSAVEGAAGYRVYRTDEVDGAAGQEHRIADGVEGTSWTDEGEDAGTEGYVPEGGLGVWQELDERLPAPVAHGAGALYQEEEGAWLLLAGGTSDGSTPLDSVLALGRDGVWVLAGSMGTARMDLGAAIADFARAPELGEASPSYLVVVGGDDGGGAVETCEFAQLLAGDELGAFAEPDRQDARGQARVDAHALVATGWVYLLGGGGDADAAEETGRQASVDGPEMALGSWSSTSQSGTFQVPRADYGLSPIRSNLFAAGGRTDTDSATASVEKVVY